jgi:DNA replication and repair protein RecF
MQDNKNSLRLTQLEIKHFRCFTKTSIELDGPLVLIEGNNGSGKTSLLEALHYLCYLRSFRTHSPREMIQFGSDGFFIKASFDQRFERQELQSDVQVGFSGKKRLVKINQQSVNSYKELIDHYRIVTLTEDDLSLISEGPEVRRAFIDQALLLYEPEFIRSIRAFKQVVDNRNSMLQAGVRDLDAYSVWTQQLWQGSQEIAHRRMQILEQIAQETNALLQEYFNGQLSITFSYVPKKIAQHETLESFLDDNKQLMHEEMRFGRSLFGAHLDDLSIKFQDKKSKAFASRGQQKLIILLLKIAQIKRLTAQKGPAVFLLDDFMTDFDADRAQVLLSILTNLQNQLIFTSPLTSGAFENLLASKGASRVKLTR